MNQYVLDITARLQEAGETIALVHSRLPRSEFRGTGYILDGLQSPKSAPACLREKLEAILEDFQPDIIQLHGVQNPWLDETLPQFCPTVRFIHTHEFYCSGINMTTFRPFQPCERPHSPSCLVAHALQGCGSCNPWKNLIRYQEVATRLRSLHHLQGIQVATKALAKNLRANHIPENKISHLPLYAAEPKFCMISTPRRRNLLHVGGLLEKKGVWLVVRMLRILPEDVEIVFAGGGEEQDALERHVRTRGLSNRIRILGDPLPDQWHQLYAAATFVILPNLWNEPLGFSALQALAYGKPVIAFRGGGITEWIEDGINGMTIPFGARAQFQQTIVQLLEQPEKLKIMGENAAKIWKTRFHPTDHLTRLRAFYAGFLNIP